MTKNIVFDSVLFMTMESYQKLKGVKNPVQIWEVYNWTILKVYDASRNQMRDIKNKP